MEVEEADDGERAVQVLALVGVSLATLPVNRGCSNIYCSIACSIRKNSSSSLYSMASLASLALLTSVRHGNDNHPINE